MCADDATIQTRQLSEIAMTGMGAVTALGASVETIWQAVRRGDSGTGPLSEIESPLPAGADGFQAVDLPADFEPDLPREARYLRWSILAAMDDAGISKHDSTNRAMVLGTTLHGMRAAGRFLRTENFEHLKTFLAGDTVRLACQNLPFPAGAATTCSACASSLSSIALGITLLQTGQADQVIAGGYDAISEYVWAGFNSLRLVADGPLKPFGLGRRGMKIGEGYAVVVLERLSDAQARGAKICGVVSGWGETSDAHHLTQPHPAGDGANRAMRGALRRAKIEPNEINLISAHATGTPDNDASEHAAMATLFSDRLSRVPVVCFKSQLGHTLGAAGAIELILATRSLAEQIAPARPIVEGAVAEFSDLQLAGSAAAPQSISYTLNTSLGFGGANTSIVMSRATAAPRGSEVVGPINLSDVCITGVGVILPGAIGNDALRARWLGEEAPATRDLLDADFEHLLNARRIRRMSPSVKLLLAAATLACRDASLAQHPELLADTGAILGTTHGSAGFSFDYYDQIVREGVLAANPLMFAEGVPNVAAAHLSMMLGLKRGCQSIIGTRTAGLDALRFAALRIAAGDSDRVIVGAAEERQALVDRAYERCDLKRSPIAPIGIPNENERGFDSSPGSTAIVLESRRSAAARGARILASFVAVDSIWNEPARLARSIKVLLKRNANSIGGDRSVLVGSANATWIDRAEQAAIQSFQAIVPERFPKLANGYRLSGESFSVTPLATLAAIILSGQISIPGVEHVDRVTALCSDWSGAATIVAIDRS